MNISQNAYNKWESDITKPNRENMMKLADFYETDIFDLLEDISGFSVNHSECNFSNIGNNSIYYNNSSEIIDGLLKNQEEVSKLLQNQNKLIEKLLKSQ